jgi:hypothetical protein
MRKPTGSALVESSVVQPLRRNVFRMVLIAGLLWGVLAALPGFAAEVWNGPTIGFTNFTVFDVDQITPSVWITRGSTMGLFNAVVENHYTHSLSPIGTEWAYGELTNYASLTYNDWEDWFGGRNGGGPPSTIGKDAVLHIIPEDIYIGITFTSWAIGGGGFTYTRTTAPTVPEPSSAVIGAVGLVLACGKRLRSGGIRSTDSNAGI